MRVRVGTWRDMRRIRLKRGLRGRADASNAAARWAQHASAPARRVPRPRVAPALTRHVELELHLRQHALHQHKRVGECGRCVGRSQGRTALARALAGGFVQHAATQGSTAQSACCPRLAACCMAACARAAAACAAGPRTQLPAWAANAPPGCGASGLRWTCRAHGQRDAHRFQRHMATWRKREAQRRQHAMCVA